MKREFSLFTSSFMFTLLLALAGCQSMPHESGQQIAEQPAASAPPQPALPVPDSIAFDCSFDLKPFLPEAPRLELGKLSDLFVWMNTRIKGGLVQNPGKRLASMVESDYWGSKGEIEGRYFRTAWLIPADITQSKYSMNILLERRVNGFVLTRVDDEQYLKLLGFMSEAGIEIKKINRRNIGYCEQLPAS